MLARRKLQNVTRSFTPIHDIRIGFTSRCNCNLIITLASINRIYTLTTSDLIYTITTRECINTLSR